MKNLILISTIIFLLSSCAPNTKVFTVKKSQPHLKILFSFNTETYPWLMGKKYPQMAVWIRENKTNYTETIFVTKSAAKEKWFGSKKRPSSVPVWYGIKKTEQKLKVDSISSATPSGNSYSILWQVPESLKGKKLNIYFEANVSFDYNKYYPKNAAKQAKNFTDVNGQPSLIWMTSIKTGQENITKKPVIIGHGHTLGRSHEIDRNLSKITTAKNLFHYIKVIYNRGSQ
jgi:hypothetical protein